MELGETIRGIMDNKRYIRTGRVVLNAWKAAGYVIDSKEHKRVKRWAASREGHVPPLTVEALCVELKDYYQHVYPPRRRSAYCIRIAFMRLFEKVNLWQYPNS